MAGSGRRVIGGTTWVDAEKAYVYGEADGGNWEQIGNRIIASNLGPYDEFGFSVSISNDGNRVAVGSLYHAGPNGFESGAAYIYDFENGNWMESKNILYGEAAEDHFSKGLSLSSNDNRLAVGAPDHDSNGLTSNGAVYVYK